MTTSHAPQAAGAPWLDSTLPVPERVQALLARMNREEKIAMTFAAHTDEACPLPPPALGAVRSELQPSLHADLTRLVGFPCAPAEDGRELHQRETATPFTQDTRRSDPPSCAVTPRPARPPHCISDERPWKDVRSNLPMAATGSGARAGFGSTHSRRGIWHQSGIGRCVIQPSPAARRAPRNQVP